MDQRVSLITLGVDDLDRARLFYAALGWREAAQSVPGAVTFYQLHGAVLGLYPRAELERDMGRAAGPGSGAVTLAINVASAEAVAAQYQEMLDAGATAVAAPAKASWGGVTAYAADPDGHVWEIAHNPFWPLSADGALVLPPEPPM